MIDINRTNDDGTTKVELTDVQPNDYSDLCVMKSAAGYYVGRYFREEIEGSSYLVPGCRDSGYYATADEAKAFLEYERSCS